MVVMSWKQISKISNEYWTPLDSAYNQRKQQQITKQAAAAELLVWIEFHHTETATNKEFLKQSPTWLHHQKKLVFWETK